jgi:hypothetical protein
MNSTLTVLGKPLGLESLAGGAEMRDGNAGQLLCARLLVAIAQGVPGSLILSMK